MVRFCITKKKSDAWARIFFVRVFIHTYIHTLLARPHGAFQSQFYITKL